MWKLVIAAVLASAALANAQQPKQRTAHKAPVSHKPVCSPGAICFSGRVEGDGEFRRSLNSGLDFVLRPAWRIGIVPKRTEHECVELAWVANPPYRAHNSLYIDASYDWTAEREVADSPREFSFVTNCADYAVEYDRYQTAVGWKPATQAEQDEALEKLGNLAKGKGRLWITGSKISHASDTSENNHGTIEWMTFTVEVRLPR